MTSETFDQSDKETWTDGKKSQWQRQIQRQRQWHKINTFREHLQRAVPQTCDLCDILQERWGDMTWHKKTMTKTNTKTKTNTVREYPERDPRDLWDLRHWLQFWQLGTWFHDNLCYLTIKCDTGQHSQFLRCLLKDSCIVQCSITRVVSHCGDFETPPLQQHLPPFPSSDLIIISTPKRCS